MQVTFVMFSDVLDPQRLALACWGHLNRTGDWPDVFLQVVEHPSPISRGSPISCEVMGHRIVLSQLFRMAEGLDDFGIDPAHFPDGYSCCLITQYGVT